MTRQFHILMCFVALSTPACATAQVETVASGFVYTEGPTADRQGNLYFTDYRDGPGRIYRLDVQGRLCLLVENSNRSNGLKVSPTGEIVACQVNGQVAAFSPDGKSSRVLTASFCGRRYNAPNDLVIDALGGVYFTDPIFDAPRPFPPQCVRAVYYISPTGEVSRLISHLWNPNGIALSPDGGTLYVVPSGDRYVRAYPVLSPGQLGPGRKFCRLSPGKIPFFPGGDGITVDAAGNLYVATIRGVQMFDCEGQLLDIIRVPVRPSNVAFAGADRRTLYITGKCSLYSIRRCVGGIVQQGMAANH